MLSHASLLQPLVGPTRRPSTAKGSAGAGSTVGGRVGCRAPLGQGLGSVGLDSQSHRYLNTVVQESLLVCFNPGS